MDDVTPNHQPETFGEIIGEIGGLVDTSRLTLGIYGEGLDPDEISRLLGCAPSTAHRRGDAPRRGPPYAEGAWLLSVEGQSPTGPEELVHLLLASLPADDGLWADLRSKFRLRLGFGIFTEGWNRGFVLSAEAVRRINALGAGLGFDIYANLDDGEGEQGVEEVG
jgi:hypothetical protein